MVFYRTLSLFVFIKKIAGFPNKHNNLFCDGFEIELLRISI